MKKEDFWALPTASDFNDALTWWHQAHDTWWANDILKLHKPEPSTSQAKGAQVVHADGIAIKHGMDNVQKCGAEIVFLDRLD